MFLFPILQCTCFYLAIGDNPQNLKLGVVNDEVQDYRDCLNTSLVTTYAHDYTCDLTKVSCRYLNIIPPIIAQQVIRFNLWGYKLKTIFCFFFASNRFISKPLMRLTRKLDTLILLDTYILPQISQIQYPRFVMKDVKQAKDHL